MKVVKTITLCLVMVALTVMVTSCKKQTESETPEFYDPSVDGVAVRSIQDLDTDQAKQINRDGTYSPTANATGAEDVTISEPGATAEATDTEVDTTDEAMADSPALTGRAGGRGPSDPNS